MKDDLTGDLEEYQGGLGSICNVFAHGGHETWVSGVPLPPLGCRSLERALVAVVFWE